MDNHTGQHVDTINSLTPSVAVWVQL